MLKTHEFSEQIVMSRNMAAAHALQLVQQTLPPQEPEPTYTSRGRLRTLQEISLKQFLIMI